MGNRIQMTRIKYIVFFLLGAIYASSWFLGLSFRHYNDGVSLIPAIVLTVASVVSSTAYVISHWNEKP